MFDINTLKTNNPKAFARRELSDVKPRRKPIRIRFTIEIFRIEFHSACNYPIMNVADKSYIFWPFCHGDLVSGASCSGHGNPLNASRPMNHAS